MQVQRNAQLMQHRSLDVRGAVAPCSLWQRWLRAPHKHSRPSESRKATVSAASKQTFTSFDDMISRSELPILVDFYATWCGPCHMLSPILDKVASSLSGRVKVVKIDTEKYPAIASKYQIQALPTLVLFKDGKPVDRIEGLPQEWQLIQRLNYFLTPQASPSS